jgi:hypothetical protein
MKTTTGIDSKLGHQFLVLVISGLIVSTAFAQELESASIDGFRLLMGLFGGLALFLFGIDQMSHGLRRIFRLSWRLANLMLPAVVSSKEA